MFKGENASITLPVCNDTQGYQVPEMVFVGWNDGTGHVYLPGDKYNVNGNHTFTAEWTQATTPYTIKHYYQMVDTENDNALSYPDEANEITQHGKSGDVVTFGEDNLLKKTGYVIDYAEINGTRVDNPVGEEITLLTSNDNDIRVYYKRATYTFSFKVNGDDTVSYESKEYVYGAKITQEPQEAEKPVKDGYAFYGWFYNNEETRPETMPAFDVEAEGFFVQGDVQYRVVYYLENLEGTYSLSAARSEVGDSFYGSEYKFEAASGKNYVKSIAGYSVQSVAVVTNGEVPATEEEAAGGSSVSGTFVSPETVVKYYYKRARYTLTVKVQKAGTDDSVTLQYTLPLGAKPNFKLGETQMSSFADLVGADEAYLRELYSAQYGENALTNYGLAGFADWSTGSAPSTMPDSNVTVTLMFIPVAGGGTGFELVNTGYIYLSQPSTNMIGGSRYISKAIIEAGTDPNLTSAVLYENEVEGLEHKKTATAYYYNGIIAAVKLEIPTRTNSKVELDYKPYTRNEYTGYYLTNSASNNLVDYCVSSPVELRAYLHRSGTTLIQDPALVATAQRPNPPTKTVTQWIPWGDSRTLPVLSNDLYPGYEFDGWKLYNCTYNSTRDLWTATTERSDVEVTPVKQDGVITSYTVIMPRNEVYAVAQWKPAVIDQEIVHLFQGVDGSYPTSLLASLRNISVEEGLNYLGNDIAVVKETDENGEYKICYYTGVTEGASVEDGRLIGIVECVKIENDQNIQIGDYAKEEYGYSYSYTNVVQGSSLILHDGDELHYQYPVTLRYYYAANRYDVNLHATIIASDGGDVGSSRATGDGDYVYGAIGVLNAEVAPGYDFVGWFNQDEALDEEGHFIPDAFVLATGTAYAFNVYSNRDLVAVIRPHEPDTAVVSITSVDEYAFGYADTTALTGKVALPEDTTGETEVESYRWYRIDGDEMTLLEEYNDMQQIPFETGKSVGEYTYLLEVTTVNPLNGRTVVSESEPYTVKVVPVQSEVVLTGAEDIFDNTYDHGYTVKCEKEDFAFGEDYVLYVSQTELTECEGGTLIDSEEALQSLNQRNAGTYGLYYYVKSLNPGLEVADQVLYTELQVKPRSVKLSAKSAITKIYDGTVDVPTDVIESIEAADVKNNTWYKVTGFIADDPDQYTLDIGGDAVYNDAHVATAATVQLSGLSLVGDGVNNYVLTADSALFDGKVTARTVYAEWTAEDGYTDEDGIYYYYDGRSHVPQVSLAAADETTGAVDGEELKLDVSVNRSPIITGSYRAGVVINKTDAAMQQGNYQAGDYKLENRTCNYRIVPCPVVLYPVAANGESNEVVYNWYNHTLSNIAAEGLPEGFVVAGKTTGTHWRTGEYRVYVADEDLMILNAAGKDVTSFFDITLESSELKITPRPVYIKDIPAMDKVYDGTVAAELGTEEVTVSGETVTVNTCVPDGKVHYD